MNKTKDNQITAANDGNDRNGKNGQKALKVWGIGLGILLMLAFWAAFAYAAWTRNFELVKIFATVIAVAAGVYGTIHFLTKLVKDVSKEA